MGGGGGTPDLKDPAGIGGSRTGLGTGGGLPEWAAGDTMGSWLTRAFPGVQMNAQNAAEATAGTPSANVAPEPTTLGAGNRPPQYAAGLGTRSEADSRAAVPMQSALTPPPAAAAAAAPTGPATNPNDWVSVGMPSGFNADPANLYAAQQQPGTYNYNGVYMPKDISQTNVNRYSAPSTTAGQSLTGDAENQPRMRRQLYDFNMNAYGNPYGLGGGADPRGRTPWWEGQPSQPGSFFMGGGG